MRHIARAGLGFVSGLLFSLGVVVIRTNWSGIFLIAISLGVLYYAWKGR